MYKDCSTDIQNTNWVFRSH